MENGEEVDSIQEFYSNDIASMTNYEQNTCKYANNEPTDEIPQMNVRFV